MSDDGEATIADRYDVVRPLGRGSFGRTLLARDRVTDRMVAVKLLDPRGAADWKARELFEREASVLRSLRHAGIPEMHDLATDSVNGVSSSVLVMEYIEGMSIADVIEQQGSMDGADAVIGAQRRTWARGKRIDGRGHLRLHALRAVDGAGVARERPVCARRDVPAPRDAAPHARFHGGERFDPGSRPAPWSPEAASRPCAPAADVARGTRTVPPTSRRDDRRSRGSSIRAISAGPSRTRP